MNAGMLVIFFKFKSLIKALIKMYDKKLITMFKNKSQSFVG